MNSITKLLAGTMLGAGVIAGVGYVKRLRQAQGDMEIIPTANLYSLNWEGVTIRIDVLLKNPTKGSFSIKFPFIKLIYKGTSIGSSQAVNKDIKITPFSEVKVENIMVRIPVTSVFSVVFALVKSFHNKEPVKLTIKTTTVVDIGITSIPYQSEQEVTVKK